METIFLYALVIVLFTISFFKDRAKTRAALKKAGKSIEGILPQLVVVLVLVSTILSLFDSGVISRLIGRDSGIVGFFGAALVGSVTLIPGFVAFPAAAELMAQGAGVLPIAAFVSTLMMVGILTFPMEQAYFGRTTALYRNILAFGFSLVAALVVGWVVGL